MWNIMKERLLKSAVIHTDDTVLPVLDKNLKKTRQGRIWVYIGDKDNPFTLFDYTKAEIVMAHKISLMALMVIYKLMPLLATIAYLLLN